MSRILRHLVAVLAGLVGGVGVLAATEAVSSSVYPLPPGIDVANTDAMKAYISGLPPGALLFVLVGLAAANLVGSWLASRMGPGRPLIDGLLVGALLLAASVANMLSLPHPGWFWAVAVIVPPGCSYLGARLGKGLALSANSQRSSV